MSKIETAAMRWIEARIDSDRLRKERGALQCLLEHKRNQARACWKWNDSDGPAGGHYEQPEGEWCDPCAARGILQPKYLASRSLTGGRLSALNRLCKAEYRRQGEVKP